MCDVCTNVRLILIPSTVCYIFTITGVVGIHAIDCCLHSISSPSRTGGKVHTQHIEHLQKYSNALKRTSDHCYMSNLCVFNVNTLIKHIHSYIYILSHIIHSYLFLQNANTSILCFHLELTSDMAKELIIFLLPKNREGAKKATSTWNNQQPKPKRRQLKAYTKHKVYVHVSWFLALSAGCGIGRLCGASLECSHALANIIVTPNGTESSSTHAHRTHTPFAFLHISIIGA